MGMAEAAAGEGSKPIRLSQGPQVTEHPFRVLSLSPPSYVEHHHVVHAGHAWWCHHHGLQGWRGRDLPCTGQQALAGALLS